ncbi:MAG: alpha/beta hydrolase [Elusimicrobia bacterium]|nr:alpha/beta hydrolase [Elusimicrobiota bacterium]
MSPAHQNILHQAFWAAGFAVLFWLGLRWFERANLYHASSSLDTDPASVGLAFEEVLARTEDGESLHGWFVDNGPASPVMVVSHGNGGNISVRLDKLLIFRGAGASVLLYDYRGYGLSTGRPSEEGTYRDADAVYEWLTARGVAPGRIVFYGESLGGAVALESSLRRPCAGLVLDSAFTSTVAMGKRLFPMLPVGWIVRYRYDNLSKIPRVRVPILVLHSPNDDIVPFDMGRTLFHAAPEPKTFFEMKGDHNDGFLETGPAYGEAIRSFLRSLGRTTSPAGAVRPLAGPLPNVSGGGTPAPETSGAVSRRPWSSAERTARKARP